MTTQHDTAQEARISFRGLFKSHNLEALFREGQQRLGLRRVSFALGLIIAVTLLLAPTDRYILGPGSVSQLLLAAVTGAYLMANLLGLLVSRSFSRLKREQSAAQLQVESALATVKTLRGTLPICAHCKKIRNNHGLWEMVEVYVRDRTHAEFSHDICPGCIQTHYFAFLEQR